MVCEILKPVISLVYGFSDIFIPFKTNLFTPNVLPSLWIHSLNLTMHNKRTLNLLPYILFVKSILKALVLLVGRTRHSNVAPRHISPLHRPPQLFSPFGGSSSTRGGEFLTCWGPSLKKWVTSTFFFTFIIWLIHGLIWNWFMGCEIEVVLEMGLCWIWVLMAGL